MASALLNPGLTDTSEEVTTGEGLTILCEARRLRYKPRLGAPGEPGPSGSPLGCGGDYGPRLLSEGAGQALALLCTLGGPSAKCTLRPFRGSRAACPPDLKVLQAGQRVGDRPGSCHGGPALEMSVFGTKADMDIPNTGRGLSVGSAITVPCPPPLALTCVTSLSLPEK